MSRMHVCPECEARWRSDGVRVDRMRRQAAWPGGVVALGPVECRLMDALAIASGHVVPQERLADALYGDDIDGGPDDVRRAIQVRVCILRRRLAAAGFPGKIMTSFGVGYELALAA